MPSFCKYCQQNGVNTRVEWQEVGKKPDGSPKNRPFDIDKNEFHSCPYLPKSFNNFKKTAAKVEQEASGSPKSPTSIQGLTKDMVNLLVWKESIDKEIRDLKMWKHDIGKAVAQLSHTKASDLMKQDEETVVE